MGKYYCRISYNGKKYRSVGDGSKGSLDVMVDGIVECFSRYGSYLIPNGGWGENVVLKEDQCILLEYIKKTKTKRRKYKEVVMVSPLLTPSLVKYSKILSFLSIRGSDKFRSSPNVKTTSNYTAITFTEEDLKMLEEYGRDNSNIYLVGDSRYGVSDPIVMKFQN